VIKHWAPWLDPLHPRPAKPGELRWFTTGEGGEDIEVDGPGPHLLRGEMIRARSRTFLPAALGDNPDLAETGYAAVLAGLPEELRRAYRDGDFAAGLRDHDFQVIPTAWIEAAQKRWNATPPLGSMTAIGVDVAQGGSDQTVLAARHGGWYAPLERKPGMACREGGDVAAMVVRARRNNCPVVVDIGGGWGAEAVGALERNGIPVAPYRGLTPSIATSRDGGLKFCNRRAEDWWRMREELDPRAGIRLGNRVAARRLDQGRSCRTSLGNDRARHQDRGQGRDQEAARPLARRRRCHRHVPERGRPRGGAPVARTAARAKARAGECRLQRIEEEVLGLNRRNASDAVKTVGAPAGLAQRQGTSRQCASPRI
jgi:hypothetical protein